MSRSITFTSAVGALAVVGAGLAAVATSPAEAASERAGASSTIARGLLSPLSVAVGADGTRYFTQNFAGVLHKQRPGKKVRVLYTSKNHAEVGAVSERDGTVRFATTNGSRAFLMGIRPGGSPRRIADLSGYETRANPDRKVTYGFVDLPTDCAAQFPADGMPPSYQGIVESHPYATTQTADGTTYVADAAANAILAVRPSGKVRTVAVLPATTLTVNASFAEQAQLPECAVGQRYRFEGVPTDVEIGPRGRLYVTTLPGGPEDGSMGAAASVYRINPKTGAVRKIAGGLVSATGLAVTPRGDLLVSELFPGRITRIHAGAKSTFAATPFPGDVEWSRSGVFATTNVLSGLSGQPGDVPDGKVVRFRR